MRAVFLTIVLLSLTACFYRGTKPDEIVFEPGLKPLPSPRTGDGPGTVYMVDPRGTPYLIGSLAVALATDSFVVPVITRTDTSDASVILKFLKDMAGNLSLGATRGRVVSIRFSATGTHRERTSLPAVEAALPTLFSEIDFQRGNYYVVMETVSADSISYEMTTGALDTLGVAAKEDTIGRLRIERKTNSEWKIVARLIPRMRIAHKVWRITPKRAGMTGTPTAIADITIEAVTSNTPLIRR